MFIGIDQSISETAITIMQSPTDYNIYAFKGKGDTTLKKLHYLYRKVRDTLWHETEFYTNAENKEDLTCKCFIEGGSYNSTGRVFSLGQLSGLIISSCIDLQIPYQEIPPATLKKFMTGNGTSGKKQMMKTILDKYDICFNNDNKADSYCLALFAYRQTYKDSCTRREELEAIYSLIPKKKESKPVRYRRGPVDF